MTGKPFERYFMDAFDVVSRARLHIILAIIIFSVSIITGALMSDKLAGLMNVLVSFAEGLKDKSTAGIIFGLFRKNALAMLIVILGGIAFGIIPMLSLALNGALIGVAMMAAVQKGLSFVALLAAIVPHGMFELPAVFIASGVAMRIGFMQFRQGGREPARSRIADGLQVFCFIVLPLLLVAAVIEGLSIARLR